MLLRYLAFFLSIETTFGLSNNFSCNCPYPTSTANTFSAPFCNKTSVKPPVEDPTSRAIKPLTDNLKIFKACANLIPPLETHG